MCENNNEDLRFNVERANDIVRLAEHRRYKFLEINLALVTAFSFLFVYLLEVLNDAGKISIIISIIIYFGCTCWNIVYNLRENRTKRIKKALCANREWKHQKFIEKIKDIKKPEFEIDYKKQLVNLHKYQKNYNKIGRNTRIYTLTGLIIFLITFVISILVNFLYTFTKLELWIMGVIIALNPIISGMLIGIVYYFMYYKWKTEGENIVILEIEIPKNDKKEFKQLIKEYTKEHKKKWFF